VFWNPTQIGAGAAYFNSSNQARAIAGYVWPAREFDTRKKIYDSARRRDCRPRFSVATARIMRRSMLRLIHRNTELDGDHWL